MAEAAASFVDRVTATPEASDGSSGRGGDGGAGADAGASGAEQSGASDTSAERQGDADSSGDGDAGKSAVSGGTEGKSGGDASDASVKTVPLAALQEARAELRALKAEIAELKAQPRLTADEKQRLASLETKRDEKTEEIKDPDFLEDPKGYIDTKLGKTLKKLEDLETTGKQRFSQIDEQERVGQIVQHVQSQEAEFAKATPDYNDALAHVRSVRSQQLKMMFPQATEAQISQQISREEFGAAQQIALSGGNVAEFAYNYAKTFGYQPKQLRQPDGEEKGEKKPDKSAARTLGGGGGATNVEPDEGGNEFKTALAERFGVRKRG